MFCILKRKKYKKHILLNSHSEKLVLFLMISNGEKNWHHLAVKKLSTLLRGIVLKHNDDLYCPSCLHSFRKKNKLFVM